VGYFTYYQDAWVFVNQRLSSLKDLSKNKEVPVNTMVVMSDGKKLLLSNEAGGRVVVVTMANKEK
jgi:hypothetical protein